jgi:hypothetical protein
MTKPTADKIIELTAEALPHLNSLLQQTKMDKACGLNFTQSVEVAIENLEVYLLLTNILMRQLEREQSR